MKDDLKGVFENVNFWLAFAEAKNAALIAFGVAWLAFFVEIPKAVSKLICILSYFSMFTCIAAITVAIFSFLPVIRKAKLLSKQSIADPINLVFYMHIATLESSQQYLEKFQEMYILDQKNQPEKLCEHYAEEIFENSIISANKYTVFKSALILQIVSIVSFVILQVL